MSTPVHDLLSASPISPRRRSLLKLAAAHAVVAGGCGFSMGALAQAFPVKPITLIVPFGAGGAVDAVARALGLELAADLKQPVLVENRPGANQIVAATYVSRAEPNGYTLMVQPVPNLIPPALLKTLPYGGNDDFAAVSPLVKNGGVLVTSLKMPGELKDFVALLKANPNKYTYGTSTIGGATHIWHELLDRQLGTKSVHIPFKSEPDMITQLINGDIDFAFVSFRVMQFVSGGKLKALGVTFTERDKDYPGVPTLQERGLTGFEAVQYFNLVATKGTPAQVIDKLNAAVAAAVARESFGSRMRALGGVQVAAPLSPAKTAELIAREDAKSQKLGIKFE